MEGEHVHDAPAALKVVGPGEDAADGVPASPVEAVAAELSTLQAAASTRPLSRYNISAKLLLHEDDLVLNLPPERLREAIATCQKGTFVTKFGRSGKPHTRFMRVSPDGDVLYYFSRRKKLADSMFPFLDVQRVQRGQHTSVFARQGRAFAQQAQLCMSVVCANGRTLDVMFRKPEEVDSWVVGLQALLIRSLVSAEDSDLRYLRRQFSASEEAATGKISADACLAILARLHVPCERPAVRAALQRVTGGEPQLAFEQFVQVVEEVRERPDIAAVFNATLSTGSPAEGGAGGVMPVEALHRFLTEQQCQKAATLEDARRLAAQYDAARGGEGMSLSAFITYLTAPSNSVFSPDAAALHQDMSQPLTSYFIESSHNTYLEGDQLKGSSSVSAYISALQKGCRCVELDCWDGPGGEPVIYHGHTLTSRIEFKDVIAALAEYGFRTTAFPLILSLEVHCTSRQQDRMADILVEAFGSRLAKPIDAAVAQLPSPLALQHQVLVKAKLKQSQGELPAAVQVEPVDPPAADIVSVGTTGCLPSLGGKVASNAGDITASKPIRPRALSRRSVDDSEHSSRDFSVKLSSLLFLRGIKSTLAAVLSMRGSCCEMVSLKEPKLARVLAGGLSPLELVKHTSDRMLRVYPGTLRVDSSNFNPCPYWGLGVQMVALNFQTFDVPARLNRSFFRQNGRCGYVLKPLWMRTAEAVLPLHLPATVAPPPAATPLSSLPSSPVAARDSASAPAALVDDALVLDTPITRPTALSRARAVLRDSPRASTPPPDRAAALSDSSLVLASGGSRGTLTLIVTVMGAQYLPRRGAPSSAAYAAAAAPALRAPAAVCSLYMYGAPTDSAKFRSTATAAEDFAAPIWGQQFRFVLHRPEVAVLYIAVHDQLDVARTTFIGYFAVPLAALRLGYRSCQLRNALGKKIPYCSLLCRFEVAQ